MHTIYTGLCSNGRADHRQLASSREQFSCIVHVEEVTPCNWLDKTDSLSDRMIEL